MNKKDLEHNSEKEAFFALWQHTKDECASCRVPHGCCNSWQCEETIRYAKDRFDIDLASTGHASLPLMGPNGCIAEPYLRPVCTVHSCHIANQGFKPDDEQWTDKYFELRHKAEEFLIDYMEKTNP
jgi:hypothetical protein